MNYTFTESQYVVNINLTKYLAKLIMLSTKKVVLSSVFYLYFLSVYDNVTHFFPSAVSVNVGKKSLQILC